MNELLKSISARINVCMKLIDANKSEDAREILANLEILLPEPEVMHIEAAEWLVNDD